MGLTCSPGVLSPLPYLPSESWRAQSYELIHSDRFPISMGNNGGTWFHTRFSHCLEETVASRQLEGL
ncbi:hypothetical protein CapIbe_012323 [Capra ibex]